MNIDNSVWAVLDPNPFYGYGGGQIPDKGIVELPEGSVIEITDVQEAFQKVLAVKLNNLPKNYSLEVNHKCFFCSVG
jgi:alanyl-tRNA synthetase